MKDFTLDLEAPHSKQGSLNTDTVGVTVTVNELFLLLIIAFPTRSAVKVLPDTDAMYLFEDVHESSPLMVCVVLQSIVMLL